MKQTKAAEIGLISNLSEYLIVKKRNQSKYCKKKNINHIAMHLVAFRLFPLVLFITHLFESSYTVRIQFSS